jgi:hypothetical protein
MNPMHPNLSLCGNIPAELSSKIAEVLAKSKTKLQRDFEARFPGQAEMIRQAVAEAEHLAWETTVPHLVLPELAEVKVRQHAIPWHHRVSR